MKAKRERRGAVSTAPISKNASTFQLGSTRTRHRLGWIDLAREVRVGGRITCLAGLHGSSMNLKFYLDMLGVVVQTCNIRYLGGRMKQEV